MKTMRKIFSILLVLTLLFGLSMTVFANEVTDPAEPETYYIAILDSVEGRTYEAFQILTGEPQTINGKKVLMNQAWGESAKKKGQEISAEDKDALEAGIAGNAGEYVDFTKPVASTKELKEINGVKQYRITGLEPGYYLVKSTDVATDDAHTAYIMQIVENVSVETKIVKPTVSKLVEDDEDPNNVWGETADHQINESFQFKLVATIEDYANYKYYDTYKLIFTDTMSAGITFEQIVIVKVGNTELDEDDYDCTAEANQDGGSWTRRTA